MKPTRKEALLAAEALARLVRKEYPPHPLSYIAYTWSSSTTTDQLAALDKVEGYLESR